MDARIGKLVQNPEPARVSSQLGSLLDMFDVVDMQRWAPSAAAALSARTVAEVWLDGRGHRQELVGTDRVGPREELVAPRPAGRGPRSTSILPSVARAQPSPGRCDPKNCTEGVCLRSTVPARSTVPVRPGVPAVSGRGRPGGYVRSRPRPAYGCSSACHDPGEHVQPPRPAHSLRAEKAFRALLADAGAQLLEADWRGNGVPHAVRCAAGHLVSPRPANLQQGQGICRVCARRCPDAAEAAFRERLAAVGAELLEGSWRGVHVPHRIRCAAGHESQRRPSAVRRSGWVCRSCPRTGGGGRGVGSVGRRPGLR